MKVTAAVLLLLEGCNTNLPDAVEFDTSIYPPPPTSITVSPGDQSVTLTWDYSDTVRTSLFKIYRSETDTAASTLAGSTSELRFTDANLINGTTYKYQISAVSEDGFEGRKSDPVAATPVEAILLFEPEIDEISIKLRWEQTTDANFRSYNIYRSEVPGVTTSSTLLGVITTRFTTTYIDREIDEATLYFYKLYVLDDRNNLRGSNEVSAISSVNNPPPPVTLAQPTQIGNNTLQLTWSNTSIPDFESYRIFRSTISPVDTAMAPIGIISGNPFSTQFQDVGLQDNTQYYYRVFVFDTGGLSSGSNEVSATVISSN